MAQMTTTQVAEVLGTDSRTLRKFLRHEGQGVGKGARYALPGTKRELNALGKRFAAWAEATRKPAEEPTEPEVETDEVFDEVEEPTDEELEQIELDD